MASKCARGRQAGIPSSFLVRPVLAPGKVPAARRRFVFLQIDIRHVRRTRGPLVLAPGSQPPGRTAPQHGPWLHRMAARTARHTRPATPVDSFGSTCLWSHLVSSRLTDSRTALLVLGNSTYLPPCVPLCAALYTPTPSVLAGPRVLSHSPPPTWLSCGVPSQAFHTRSCSADITHKQN